MGLKTAGQLFIISTNLQLVEKKSQEGILRNLECRPEVEEVEDDCVHHPVGQGVLLIQDYPATQEGQEGRQDTETPRVRKGRVFRVNKNHDASYSDILGHHKVGGSKVGW